MKLPTKQILVLPLLCALLNNCIAQREADIWVVGSDILNNSIDSTDGTSLIDFTTEPPTMNYESTITLDYLETNASIANADGQYLFSTNGMQIYDFQNRAIADTIAFINDGLYWLLWSEPPDFEAGFFLDQGALILPLPDSENLYTVIYHYMEYNEEVNYYEPNYLLEARVSIDREGEPELIYKDSILIDNTFFGFGKYTACRHANGRDWWIVIPDREGPNYYMYLLTPDGIQLHHIQDTGKSIDDGVGTAWFSENGKWYVKSDGISVSEGTFLNLYAFNRCEGLLFNHTQLHINSEFIGGAVVSPNNRFFYATSPHYKLFQWDLQAQDIEESRILIDTFDGYVDEGARTTFGKMLLSPHGKPYIIPTTTATKFMHVVNRPNEKGKDCNFVQRQIMLPTRNHRSLPNYANFRLGPIDGSECDTLGIDNIPVAKWRHELQSPDNDFEIRFTDRSYYNPEEWYWDFDDGSSSVLQHPRHTYASTGTYHVCLTVSNENASDSSCQYVNVTVTATGNPDPFPNLEIFPNPVSDYLNIKLPSQEHFKIQITTVDGQIIFNPTMTCPCKLNLSSLSPGVYILNLFNGDMVVHTEKVVKM